MPLRLIKGSYRLIGSSPDGDSVRFYPADKDAFSKVGIRAKLNAGGGAQLRLDAIDALETHYTPPGSPHSLAQPKALGEAAASSLLTRLGFSDVTRDDRNIVTASTPESVDGYILTRFADKYGRPVALVYAGGSRRKDGASVMVDVELMQKSANFGLLADGLVYPTFYSQLYLDLRQAFAAASIAAREAGIGVWENDATLPGFTLSSLKQLTESVVILPKLFRRLTEYLVGLPDDSVSLKGFHEFLSTQPDAVVAVSTGQTTNFDTFIRIDGQRLSLILPPEDLVFQEG